MPIKPIVTIPSEILSGGTQKVRDFGKKDTTKIVQDLRDTLNSATEPEGAGLAANQIGYDKGICLVKRFYRDPNNEEEMLSKDVVLINPKIISQSKETDIRFEGCLSVPDEYGKVERFRKIKVKALDENGEPLRISTSGFFARTIQHEIDHLNGIVFTEKVIGDTITEEELDRLHEETEDVD
jgi:peptide deformylase